MCKSPHRIRKMKPSAVNRTPSWFSLDSHLTSGLEVRVTAQFWPMQNEVRGRPPEMHSLRPLRQGFGALRILKAPLEAAQGCCTERYLPPPPGVKMHVDDSDGVR